ncbi:MAG: phosphohistidine phosphatase SixA [Solirubrobacterales bacterium]|nr:phosphohistidine phosphatase SixA [Solirubrobacterales bacterium]
MLVVVRHTLYLLRHAKSSWDDPELSDRARPLAKRGRRAVALLGEHLRETAVAPDLVLCSSAVRAVETLEGVRDGLPPGVAVEIEDDLYSADAAALLERLRALREAVGSVMLVGHNPELEELAGELAGGGDPDARARVAAKYPTGGLATLAFEGTWRRLDRHDATLEAFAVPRELGR